MRDFSTNNPQLPFASQAKSYAAHPVWKDSARGFERFVPMARREAVRVFHEARRFERSTRARRKQDGALGRNGILVLHTLIFDCLNYRTGQLDPSYAAIARLAHISLRSVARGLAKLKAAGVLDWVRRCRESSTTDGKWCLEQDTNAYAILPPTQWRGFRPTPRTPKPEPGTSGEHPPQATGWALAAEMVRDHLTTEAMRTLVGRDPSDWEARAAIALKPRGV
jgi:hypothetical protein